ncbi:MAG: hypothetical protein WDW38_003402 [Sanguina aurantia]
MLSAVVAGLTAVILAWMLMTKVPGPMFLLPFIGESVSFFASPLQYACSRFKKYGPIFRTSLFGYQMYITSDAAAIKEVWSTGIFYVPGASFHMLLPHTSHLKGAKEHPFFRKTMSLSLGSASIETYFPKLLALIEEHVDQWGKAGVVPLTAACTALAMDLGVDIVSGVRLQHEDREEAKTLFLALFKGLYGIPINLPGTNLRAALDAKKRLTVLLWKELEELSATATLKYAASQEAAARGVPEPERELLPMMEAQLQSVLPFRALDQEVVVDRAIGNVIASGDTTRHMMFLSLVCLAKSARATEKVLQEQKQVVADHGSNITFHSLSAMPYLDACIREAIRLLPATMGGFRKTVKAMTVKGVVVPAGSIVFWSTHLLHAMDPALLAADSGKHTNLTSVPLHMDWSDHFDEAYIPERWLTESSRPKTFTTFGGGVHLCPGMQLAYSEVKILIATVMRRFEVALDVEKILSTCSFFPGPLPAPGTDGLICRPRSPCIQ